MLAFLGIGEFMSSMLHSISQLGSPWAYVVVGGLATAEAAAFLGLIAPGEIGLLIGGFIAQQGRASLSIMMLVAFCGAVLGDSIGYEIGRHLGPRLQKSRLGSIVGEARWEKAHVVIANKGGRAVLAGRFVGVLRAVVPAVAGSSRLRYRTFLFWNVIGAALTAPTLVLAGYLAGKSYPRVEHYVGRAGSYLLVVAIVGGLVYWKTKESRKGDEPVR